MVVVDRFSEAAHFCMLPSNVLPFHLWNYSPPWCVSYTDAPRALSQIGALCLQVIFGNPSLNRWDFSEYEFFLPPTNSWSYRGCQSGDPTVSVLFVHDYPNKWGRLFHWQEWYYNTTSHFSWVLTPYQAVYGRSPATILQHILRDHQT